MSISNTYWLFCFSVIMPINGFLIANGDNIGWALIALQMPAFVLKINK